MLRTTAQGITFAVARAALGIWSLFVPTIAAAGFEGVALILVIFLSISGVVGLLFMPNTEGRWKNSRPKTTASLVPRHPRPQAKSAASSSSKGV